MTTKAMNAPLQKGKSRLNRNNGWDYLMIGVLVLFALICVYPFWYVVIGSFSDGADYMRGGVYLWPREWSLQNYQVTLVDSRLWIGFRVTIARTFICTITHVLFTAMVAYAMSRSDLPCRKFIYWFNMFTMFFGGGLIPTYLLMVQLGFVNSFAVYIIPGLFSAYYMLLASSYMESIPSALFESARIDGASETRTFASIALPLAKPMLACIAVYIGVGHWNSWFDVSLYSKNGAWDTLQIILYRLLNQANAKSDMFNQQQLYASMRTIQPETVRAAITIVVVVPILFIYPFFQRYFVGGITLGAVKG